MQLRITAFPSDMIRKESTSREILSQLLDHLENYLKTVSFNLPKYSMGAGNYPNRGEVRSGSINKVSGIKTGDKVQSVLLEEKTQKGGW